MILLRRLLFVLPMVLAVGVWAGHQTLAGDLVEKHPDYPIELTSLAAPLPDPPAPVLYQTILPPTPYILPIPPGPVPEDPVLASRPPRGPPTF
jgi:hypothetical protein